MTDVEELRRRHRRAVEGQEGWYFSGRGRNIHRPCPASAATPDPLGGWSACGTARLARRANDPFKLGRGAYVRVGTKCPACLRVA